MKTKLSVAIIYGWAEGAALGRRLTKKLREAGFSNTHNAASADIIIAHSGGSFLIPNDSQARLIILVGIPHSPNRHPAMGVFKKIRIETKDKPWAYKSLLNAYYYYRHPRRAYRMWRGWKNFNLPEANDDLAVIAIRNHEDAFMHEKTAKSLAKGFGWQLIHVPGQHDDIWLNPEPYVDIIIKAWKKIK